MVSTVFLCALFWGQARLCCDEYTSLQHRQSGASLTIESAKHLQPDQIIQQNQCILHQCTHSQQRTRPHHPFSDTSACTVSMMADDQGSHVKLHCVCKRHCACASCNTQTLGMNDSTGSDSPDENPICTVSVETKQHCEASPRLA